MVDFIDSYFMWVFFQVLVKPLAEKGFLLLLSSSHMHSSKGTLLVHLSIHTPVVVVVVVLHHTMAFSFTFSEM